MKARFLGPIAILAVFAGCATVAGPGSYPGAVPPKLVMSKDYVLQWNDPGAFGPVPKSLQAAGDSYCRRFVEGRAVGYHPLAQDQTGKTFKDGGFYCVR